MPAGVTSRLAVPADAPALARLMIEMQLHNGASHPPVEEIEAALLELPAGVEFLIAEDGAAVVGLAAFSTLYPGPGLAGGLFLKDLYVSVSARDDGVGQSLMRRLARLAASRGLKRIDWTVGKDNAAALRFYDRLGARPQDDRHFYRLIGDAFATLARE